MKKYVLIAGVNGAGKSTLYQMLETLQELKRVNTDEIVRSFGDWHNLSDVMRAGKIAVHKINEYLENGVSFNQETTLCGKNILRTIELARKNNYYIELHYVGVESVDIAKARVTYRVKQGGHGIPESDIERRYVESLNALSVVAPLCNQTILYDNTEKIRRFALYEGENLVTISDEIPQWYANSSLFQNKNMMH